MDRQSLLEQKRQRLQELKLRRLGSPVNDEAKIELLIQKLADTPKVGVSIGVQVDPINHAVAEVLGLAVEGHKAPKIEKECLTYDKAVQTIPVVIEHKTVSPQTTSPKPETEVILVVEDVNEEELNNAVKESIKLVHRINVSEIKTDWVDYTKRLDNTSHTSNKHTFDITPYTTHSHVEQTRNRPVCCMDFSPHHPELFVVAYSHSDLKNSSPGLAIIYSVKEDKVFPEFYLHCTSSISCIKFDQVTSTKIIGGLSDGKIVIWNLEEINSRSVAVLPTLITPMFSMLTSHNSGHSSNIDFKHHTSAITSLIQLNIDGNDSIVSFSLDGTINTWSTNLLASPSLDSVKLAKDGPTNEFTNFKETFRILKAIALTSGDRTSHINLNISGGHQFLNDIVVVSDSGTLFQLSSQESQEFIKFSHEERVIEEDSYSSYPNDITDFQKLPSGSRGPYLITSNLDWTFKIWSPSSKTPLMSIPTKSLVLRIAIRPNRNFQFVTLGLMSDSNLKKSVLEFWDLESTLFKPVFEIPVPGDIGFATTVSFNQDGSKLLAGFGDGSFIQWPIVEESLRTIIDAHRENKLDEGILYYLHRN
ncbi:WD40 repeat-like protein [Suhomyces tanzawaensis NRRL Y-17324]|uniref:WD40 repeat-like protein n=1 Tax=Suhomyces tanzawaensis NRRL Y-17324 TaxID=984487 RepID=A0A1E4SJ77_9ASCO|nr:WD40 repeat-like protein [Suhomyces tanzawaensis NRRL Y-17324]ODV79566.1 WD40 repeat-like protein [Suhomyces tanzawaensis NRRL Y-17324]